MSRIQKDTLKNRPEVYAEFERWKENLYEAYGKAGRAQEDVRKGGSLEAVEAATAAREQIWRAGLVALSVLVDGGTADSRRSQAEYQQSLCMHEQAERLQARAAALAHADPPADADEVKAARGAAEEAWRDAADWWTSYTQKYPLTPFGIQARLLLARVREAQGKPEVARALLEDSAGVIGEKEQVKRLYLARRLKTP